MDGHWMHEWITAVGFNVLHGNTDSVMLCLQSGKLGKSSYHAKSSVNHYKILGHSKYQKSISINACEVWHIPEHNARCGTKENQSFNVIFISVWIVCWTLVYGGHQQVWHKLSVFGKFVV